MKWHKITPQLMVVELVWRVDQLLPAQFKATVVDLPDGAEWVVSKSVSVDFDPADINLSADQFSEKCLQPIAVAMATELRLLTGPWLDREIVLFRIPHGRNNLWSEQVNNRRISISGCSRFFGDKCHFSVAYRPAEKAMAA